MVLEIGETAPAVSAPNQHGERIDLPVDGPTVLYFYPRDGTPGCTREAAAFGAELPAFDEADVDVYGVSSDGVDSHREFAARENIEFDLLADPDGEIAAAYGVPRGPTGAVERTTFVVLDGRIQAVYESVTPGGHAREVLGDLPAADVTDTQ